MFTPAGLPTLDPLVVHETERSQRDIIDTNSDYGGNMDIDDMRHPLPFCNTNDQ